MSLYVQVYIPRVKFQLLETQQNNDEEEELKYSDRNHLRENI